MEDCLFCKIVDGQIPATIVYDGTHVIAFQDIHPAAKHHVLFIPRRHIRSVDEITREHGEILGELFSAIAEFARQKDLADPDRGYRVVSNIGPDAGQSVSHLHFHVIGGREMGWPPFPVSRS